MLTRQRERLGTASTIDTLDTERQRMEAEQNLAQAQAAVTIDYIALQKSLGVGWADAPQPSAIPATPAPIKD
jgi:outer membrane protein TolC